MPDGDIEFDLSSGITGAVGRAVRAPGEAMRGEFPVTDAAGNITPEAYQRSAEFGVLMSPVNPGIRAGDRAIPGAGRAFQAPRERSVSPPSRERLHGTATRQYQDFRSIDAEYSLSDIQRLAEETRYALNERGFTPRGSPQTFGVLDDIAAIPPGGIVRPNEIQSIRQSLGRAARPSVQYAADAPAASVALSRFDEFVQAYGKSAAPEGGHARASRVLAEANENWGALRRSDIVTGIEDTAHLRSSAANAGLNGGNAIRQRVASALISGRPLRSFNPQERAVLRQIVEGTFLQNRTRDVGSFLGGGSGMGGYTAAGGGAMAGAALGGPEGAAIGAIGVGALGRAMRVLTNRLTERALRRADDEIRRRSHLYRQMLRETPMEGRSPEQRMALVRIMMALQFGAQDEQRQRLEGRSFQ